MREETRAVVNNDRQERPHTAQSLRRVEGMKYGADGKSRGPVWPIAGSGTFARASENRDVVMVVAGQPMSTPMGIEDTELGLDLDMGLCVARSCGNTAEQPLEKLGSGLRCWARMIFGETDERNAGNRREGINGVRELSN